MICSVRSLGLTGVSGYQVTAECFISNGLPAFEIVGLPDAAVKESRERVRAAAKSSGFRFPVSRITVNLAPAGMKKTGTLYDLPILLGLLAASQLVKAPERDHAFLGELSLEGNLRPVSGVLPMALAAKEAGIRTVCPGGERCRGHPGPGAGGNSCVFYPAAGGASERGTAHCARASVDPWGRRCHRFGFSGCEGAGKCKAGPGDCRSRGGTMCCSSARRDLERACSASGCPLFCRT